MLKTISEYKVVFRWSQRFNCSSVTLPLARLLELFLPPRWRVFAQRGTKLLNLCKNKSTIWHMYVITCLFCYLHQINKKDDKWPRISNFTFTFLFKDLRCENLPKVKNGRSRLTNGSHFGSVVTYKCKKPYKLRGSATRTCRATGKWDGGVIIMYLG